MDVLYPEIDVRLTGHADNAFAIIGTVRRALLRGGVSGELVQKFTVEAKSGDYDHLLQTAMHWVTVS